MRWQWVLAGVILSTGLVVPPVHAQQDPGAGVAVSPVVVVQTGVPSELQITDIRWSGDRLGESTLLSTLPPAFRRAEGHSGPDGYNPAALRPAPTPAPTAAPR